MSRLIVPFALLLVLTGCRWVQLTPEGEGVRVITLAQAAGCTRIGTTASNTSSRVLFVPRGGEQVQDELVILARNEAGLMGGNAIMAETIIQDGRQRYIVYNCP